MDHNALLQRAFAVMQKTRDVLEQVLDDDDDMVLSSTIIGEEAMITETDRAETETLRRRSEDLRRKVAPTLRRFGIVEASNDADQQRINEFCEHVFNQVASLSHQQRRTAEEAQQFFGSIDWRCFPADRSAAIRHYFTDPAKLSMLIEPSRNFSYEESTRLRIEADQEIVALFEALHRELRKFEPRVIDTRPFPERLRAECFSEVARLSGKSEKTVAKVYQRLNWQLLPKDRNAEIQRELCPELPTVATYDARRSATNQREYEQHQRAIRERALAGPRAVEATRQIILLFQNLRGELSAYRMAQAAKANEAKRIDQRIERLQQVRAAM